MNVQADLDAGGRGPVGRGGMIMRSWAEEGQVASEFEVSRYECEDKCSCAVAEIYFLGDPPVVSYAFF